MALLQCIDYLDQHPWKLIESEDTALSARHIAEKGLRHTAAIASELAAEMKTHLGWLVEKGHVVQYFNGLLAAPEAHPKFRNVSVAKKADEAPAAEPAAAEVPVAEPAVAEAVPAEVAPAAENIVIEEKKEEVQNETADKLAE
jgi:hypothetical protein